MIGVTLKISFQIELKFDGGWDVRADKEMRLVGLGEEGLWALLGVWAS